MGKLWNFLFLLNFVLRCSSNQQLSPPYTCTTTVCQPGNSVSSEGIRSSSQQGRPGKRGVTGHKGDKGEPCHCDVADEEALQSIRDEWNKKIKHYDEVIERLIRLNEFPENCSMRQHFRSSHSSEENAQRFDVVPIFPLIFIGDLTPWMVNCTKMLSDGTDGWIIIQRRQDGGTDFYRGWESYAEGFGNRHEEFWLGLRNIHKITTARSCKLRIDMEDFSGSKKYAQYDEFKIENEESNFRLRVFGYSGNIKDSLAYHNGQAFSTVDRDNDKHSSRHCAQVHKGPWWHKSCDNSNLNGMYYKTGATNSHSVWWDGFSTSLSYVEMKLHCS